MRTLNLSYLSQPSTMAMFSEQSQTQETLVHTHCFGGRATRFSICWLSYSIDMTSILISPLIIFFNFFHVVPAWSPKVNSLQVKDTSVSITNTLPKEAKESCPHQFLLKLILFLNAPFSPLTSLGKKGLHEDLPSSGLTVPFCLSIILDLCRTYPMTNEEKRMWIHGKT